MTRLSCDSQGIQAQHLIFYQAVKQRNHNDDIFLVKGLPILYETRWQIDKNILLLLNDVFDGLVLVGIQTLSVIIIIAILITIIMFSILGKEI